MWTMSPAMQELLRVTHQITTRIVFFPPSTQTEPWPSALVHPNVFDDVILRGEIRIDKQSTVRRRGNVTLQLHDESGKHAELINALAYGELRPFGSSCRIYRGVMHHGPTIPGGFPELVPLGHFEILDVLFTDSGGRRDVKLELADFSYRVARQELTTEYKIANGTAVHTAIRTILGTKVGLNVPYAFESTAHTTPAVAYGPGTNLWKACEDLAVSAGMELFFAPDLTCVLRTEPDPVGGDVVWEYDADDVDNSVVLEARRQLSQRDTYNHVIVTGETVGNAPVRAEVVDDNPGSPTYVSGPFKRRPLFHQDTLIKTTSAAQSAALALFRKHSGLEELVVVQSLVNPAHEAGDIVFVQRDSATIGSKYSIESATIPLTAPIGMALTARRRTQ